MSMNIHYALKSTRSTSQYTKLCCRQRASYLHSIYTDTLTQQMPPSTTGILAHYQRNTCND